MIDWLGIYKHLLPRARAWLLTPQKTLRAYFQGLTGVNQDVKTFIDKVWLDIFPQTTRQLSEWENQFNLRNTGLDEQGRRDRLDATWKALGGQSPRYIQDTLQAAGFDVYVHEWWVPNPTQPLGGSNNGDVTAVARNPFDYIHDGALSSPMSDGGGDAQDGDVEAQDGNSNVPKGYLLVNKRQTYTIPLDPTKYPYFLYIGGETFSDQATVVQSRRQEFEDLCLKICPCQQWLGMLIDYT